MAKQNFLLGKGERLTTDIVIPSGGGPKEAPYTFEEARGRLTPMVADAGRDHAASVGRLDRHGGGNRADPGEQGALFPESPLHRTGPAAARSRVHSAVEHPFAEIKSRMGLFVHTIGIDRATAKVGMANIAFEMKQLSFRERKSAMS